MRCGVGLQAKELALTAHVRLSELLIVDCREAPRLLEEFPHYVPCAVSLLARVLEDFPRAGRRVGLHFGQRRVPFTGPSAFHPGHDRSSTGASAADVYRIGDTFLNTRSAIEKYAAHGTRHGPRDQRFSLRPPTGRKRRPPASSISGIVRLVPPGCDETVAAPVTQTASGV